jgi:hypothetical protein
MSRAGAPLDFVTEYGQDPPMCTQFSVFLDNRVGKLYELVELFDTGTLKLVALSVIDASDYAVVRLVTTKAEEARKLLTENKMSFTEAEMLVVELGPDKRLTKLCLSLLSAELNIFYAYPLMVRLHGAATLALHCDDLVLAGQILMKKGFALLGEEELRHAAGGERFED